MTRNKLYVLLICILLVVSTLVAFEQVRHNEFVDYDDYKYVTENSHVTDSINGKSVIWAFTTMHTANWHPLTWLSHMLDCQLFGLNPLWHHMINLLFHIVNTLLLFLILKKMTGAVWRSAFVAAAFALHPLHVESVAWVAERKDVLSGFFWMLTIAAYIRYVERPVVKRYVLLFLVFGLGLMAKPMVITLPFVLLLLDYWPLNRMQQKSKNNTVLSIRHLIVEKIPFFVLAAASGTVTFIAQRIGGAMSNIDKVPLAYRIGNAGISYINYIAKMIYPTRLAVLYPFYEGGLPKWQLISSSVILIVICIGIINAARRHRYLAVGWLWYLGTLVPVIGLVQVGAQTMADRYTYLPSIGIFIMIAWGANELLARYRLRKIVLAISAGVVLIIWLICTRVQVSYWQDSSTLFKHTLSVTKNNYIMHNNYGSLLSQEGLYDEALAHFREALRINPQHLKARINVHSNLAIIMTEQEKYAEAVSYLREVLRLSPDSPYLLNNLAWILATREDGNLGDSTEAVQYAERACELVEYNQPDFLDTLAIAYASAGRFKDAIQTAEKAIKIALSTSKKELAEKIQKQLQAYKTGRPYRE